MYTVQVRILIADFSPTYETTDLDTEWADIVTVGQLDTEQAELQEACRVAGRARGLYRDVRIVKSLPGGAQEAVR
jgi:hypothetical protein